jgi:hypothetical protein
MQPLPVGIHQPNHFPWLGYFAKMARSDAFVLLDDVQYTRLSYINRVSIKGPRWLTVPVSYRFGDPIHAVRCADPNWKRRRAQHRAAPHYGSMMPWVASILESVPGERLGECNVNLLKAIGGRLGMRCRLLLSSEFGLKTVRGDDRIIAILQGLGGDVRYLSGKGGAKYQDPAKFEAAGIPLIYANFRHPTYDQAGKSFTAGLSILDAGFYLGLDEVADLIGTRVKARTLMRAVCEQEMDFLTSLTATDFGRRGRGSSSCATCRQSGTYRSSAATARRSCRAVPTHTCICICICICLPCRRRRAAGASAPCTWRKWSGGRGRRG